MKILLVLGVMSFAMATSCIDERIGENLSETRQLESFTEVYSGGSWEVILEEGFVEQVHIEANGIALEKVKTEVNGNVLSLGLERGNYSNVDLKFYVTYKKLEGVKLSGSGEMEVKNNVITDSFTASLSGSGDISMKNLMADRMVVGISGSATMEIEGGEVGIAEIKQSGSGDFEGENLYITDLTVSKSGSGDTKVGEIGKLSVYSSGSGDVIYSGSPIMGTIKTSGSSSIRKR